LEALSIVVDRDKMLGVIKHYARLYKEHYIYLMSKKLGFDEVVDSDIVSNLLGSLGTASVDYTLFFRTLSHYNGNRSMLLELCSYKKPMNDWLDIYDRRLEQNSSSATKREASMLKTNPKYVLKNYMLQEAINSAKEGDFSLVAKLFDIAQNPYVEHDGCTRWSEATPDEFKNKKLSCSS
jgi:uncharacterized protein YdiU (UPF0061 family)